MIRICKHCDRDIALHQTSSHSYWYHLTTGRRYCLEGRTTSASPVEHRVVEVTRRGNTVTITCLCGKKSSSIHGSEGAHRAYDKHIKRSQS